MGLTFQAEKTENQEVNKWKRSLKSAVGIERNEQSTVWCGVSRKGVSQKFPVQPNLREETDRTFQEVATASATVIPECNQGENPSNGEH